MEQMQRKGHPKASALIFEGVEILFRNFRGLERIDRITGRVLNQEGRRNFCLKITDEDEANRLSEQGWKVKLYTPADGSEPFYYIPVAVNFNVRKEYRPEIKLYTKRKATNIDEESVDILDSVIITNIDLSINPSWYIDQNTGEWKIKAYLRSMFITIEEDRLKEKYAAYEHPEDDDEEALPFC